jgi:hypothetical protein
MATIYAAGAYAIECGILLWSKKELGRALLHCEKAHVEHVTPYLGQAAKARKPVGGVVRTPMQRLEDHVANNASRFVDLRKKRLSRRTQDVHQDCAGYINCGADGSVEYLFSNKKFMEICGGQRNARIVKSELARVDALIRDGHRPSTRRNIFDDGQRDQVIAIRASFFR